MSLPTFVLVVLLPVLSLALLLTLARLLRGPSLPDRVIALDMMATLGIGVVAVYAVFTGQPALLDVAICLLHRAAEKTANLEIRRICHANIYQYATHHHWRVFYSDGRARVGADARSLFTDVGLY